MMFLGLKLIKYDDLGSKRHNLGFKRSEKYQKDPYEGCCRASRRQGLMVLHVPDARRWVRCEGLLERSLLK